MKAELLLTHQAGTNARFAVRDRAIDGEPCVRGSRTTKRAQMGRSMAREFPAIGDALGDAIGTQLVECLDDVALAAAETLA